MQAETEMLTGDSHELVDESGAVVPHLRCQCGGTYALGYVEGAACLDHSLPFCDRYRAVRDTDQAVAFSKENREALP